MYCAEHPPKNVQYYKGLGTFTKAQSIKIGKSFQKYVKQITYVKERDDKLINALFGKDAEQRKAKILAYKPHLGQNRALPTIGADYLMDQVTEYSVSTLSRAIPDFIDGLKES